MLKQSLAAMLLATAAGSASAQSVDRADNQALNDGPQRTAVRPVSTYSIVARDPKTGELGAAVQSHWFSVGPIVVWAEPGIGAVATQSIVLPQYGPDGLASMRAGMSAREALDTALAADEFSAVRQVGMVDAQGRVAAHTGENAIAEACHIEGEGFSVHANLMLNDTVCQAMFDAYRAAEGDLAERLMIALEAAEAEGGDIRGKQSAALLVVSGDASAPAWGGRIFDLRVEDDPEPLEELRRLLQVARVYRLMQVGDDAMAEGDMDAASDAYAAASALAPDNHEVVFWHAVTMATGGDMERARPLFDQAFEAWPQWRETVPRLVDAGFIPSEEMGRAIVGDSN